MEKLYFCSECVSIFSGDDEKTNCKCPECGLSVKPLNISPEKFRSLSVEDKERVKRILKEKSLNDVGFDTETKKTTLSWGKIILYVLVLLALLWGYGFVKAAKDVDNGLNLIGLAYRIDAMNPVSASGYRVYIRNYTDAVSRINSLF